MYERKIAALSMPIEALLDIITGRATVVLPDTIPPDAKYLYAYIDEEKQVIKLILTHEKFPPRDPTDFVVTHRATILKLFKKEEAPQTYEAETLVNSENWARLV